MTRSEFISLLEQDGFTHCYDDLYVKEVGSEFHDGFIHTTFEVDEDVAVRRVICHAWQSASGRLMESVRESLIRYHKELFIGDTSLQHIGQIYIRGYTVNDYHHYINPEDMDTAVEGN